MNDDDVLNMVETLHRQGVRAELRIGTHPETGRVIGRSWYYDGDERLLITTYEPVDAVDLPDGTLDDEDRGHAYYLRETEGYYRVDEEFDSLSPDSDSGGWWVNESVENDPAGGPMPVDRDGRVVREAEDLPVPVFITYQHHNLRDDVFEEGGLWDEVMSEGADEEVSA